MGLCDACNIVPNISGVKLEAKDKISLIYIELGKPYAHHTKGVLCGGYEVIYTIGQRVKEKVKS